jgi:hypothetical protein
MLLVGFMAVALFGLALWFLNQTETFREAPADYLENLYIFSAFALYGVVGALAAARQPENRIGWVFQSVAMFTGLAFVSEQYAIYGLVTRPGALPAAEWVAWPSFWMWIPGIGYLITFLLLLFPTGRLPSPRWRPVAWAAGVSMAALSAFLALAPEPLITEAVAIPNPLAVPALAGLGIFEGIAFAALLGCGVLSAASLLLRFKSASAVERQQLKWFCFAASLLVVALILNSDAVTLQVPQQVSVLSDLLFYVGVAAVPVATGMAVLRYRLWDIDVIIRRTLLYTALSLSLAVVYLGSVLVLQTALRLVTEQSQSQLVTVLSTLVLAVAFTPLRRRLQTALDRRFYRQRYDAGHILQAFGASVSNEAYADLDVLADRLVAVVGDVLQPAHMSMWLAPTAPREPHTNT